VKKLLISLFALVLTLVWLPIGFVIWVTTDGDCAIAPWCEGHSWPEWTGYPVLVLWAAAFVGIWYLHYRLRKDDEFL